MMELIIDLIIALIKALAKNHAGSAAPPREPEPGWPSPRPEGAPPPPAPPAAEVAAELARIEIAARAEAARCEREEPNRRFVATLHGFVATAAAQGRGRIVEDGAAASAGARLGERLAFLLQVMSEMAAQRRQSETLLLLGDADALADACYRPIVEFARRHEIRLSSEETATFLGDKDLAIFLGFSPTGLAPIVLPSAWATEIGWWPALAHEIGHDFFAAVPGLERELVQDLDLPGEKWLPESPRGMTLLNLTRAFRAWLPEIFADAFGTLMLGPAYLRTMMWSFADPAAPANVLIAAPGAGGAFDDHPPRHLRVVLGCRLLAGVGFPGEANRLEREWRSGHGEPDRLLVPVQTGEWLAMDEEPFVQRGAAITWGIYQDELQSLAGFEIRSIPGLDLGPREHEAAIEAKAAYFAGRRAATTDPRCLIAGAVLAWHEQPARAAGILRAARATIPALGVGRSRLRGRAESSDLSAAKGAPDLDGDLFREALVLQAILEPPPSLRRRR